jgi:hypothetical protein
LFSIIYGEEGQASHVKHGIGMFSVGNGNENAKTDISEYMLNFREIHTTTEVVGVGLYNRNEWIATIDENGLHYKNENGLGDYSRSLTVTNNNKETG